MKQKALNAGTVFYDGSCGMCSRGVIWLGPLFERAGLRVAPLQEAGARERLGVGPEELLTDIRMLTADGNKYFGADVYRYVLRRVWWVWPVYVMSVTPGLRWVFDKTYRAVAKRRYRLSKACRIQPLPKN